MDKQSEAFLGAEIAFEVVLVVRSFEVSGFLSLTGHRPVAPVTALAPSELFLHQESRREATIIITQAREACKCCSDICGEVRKQYSYFPAAI